MIIYTSLGFFGLSVGAGRGNRTPMTSRSRDFESRASTNSAIPAKLFVFFFRRGIITENPICGNP